MIMSPICINFYLHAYKISSNSAGLTKSPPLHSASEFQIDPSSSLLIHLQSSNHCAVNSLVRALNSMGTEYFMTQQ